MGALKQGKIILRELSKLTYIILALAPCGAFAHTKIFDQLH